MSNNALAKDTKSFTEFLKKRMPSIQRVAASHMRPDRLYRIVLANVSRTPALLKRRSTNSTHSPAQQRSTKSSPMKGSDPRSDRARRDQGGRRHGHGVRAPVPEGARTHPRREELRGQVRRGRRRRQRQSPDHEPVWVTRSDGHRRTRRDVQEAFRDVFPRLWRHGKWRPREGKRGQKRWFNCQPVRPDGLACGAPALRASRAGRTVTSP